VVAFSFAQVCSKLRRSDVFVKSRHVSSHTVAKAGKEARTRAVKKELILSNDFVSALGLNRQTCNRPPISTLLIKPLLALRVSLIMSIPIYLARYPSGSLFNDHWALFIPDHTRPSPTCGTLLEVEGDPLNGFVHDVARNCDARQEYYGRHQPVLVELGTVSEQHLEGDVGAVKGMENLEPRSDVERLALSTEPPSKSMRSAGNGKEGTARKRIEVRDCQWWVKEVVKKLITEKILTQEAMSILEQVPAH
jgi:hypothetical protein